LNGSYDVVAMGAGHNGLVAAARSVDREGDNLVVKGHAYGTMPLSITIRPSQARRLFELLKLSVLPFLLGFPFRRNRHGD
jgi:hypothetical protein